MYVSKLLQAVQNASPHALLILTSRALSLAGYDDVAVVERNRESHTKRHTGHDITCALYTETHSIRLIVKVCAKQVRLRHLHEMASLVIKERADLGLIVSPGTTSKEAEFNEAYFRGRSVALLTGQDFEGLLRSHGIGVRDKGEIDFAFFGRLEETSQRLLSLLGRTHA